MIAIISGHIGVHGSLLNLLDFQDYLIRQGHKVTFYCFRERDFVNNIIRTRRCYKMGKIRRMMPKMTAETIVTDFKTLFGFFPVRLQCKNLVIFDNAELTYHLNDVVTPFYPNTIKDITILLNMHEYENHMFLMPESNYGKFRKRYPWLNAKMFYKKINTNVLSTIRTESNGKYFYRVERGEDIPEKYKAFPTPDIKGRYPDAVELLDLKTMFQYDGYIYYRRKDRAFYEQFGRMIFEFLLLNKDVKFYDDPCQMADGLCDYWDYYNKVGIDNHSKDYEYKPWEKI
jgi:hypothetical protein